ncbi:MAG: helix-turn-helix transcriptional regulator [Bacteroidales bacterium]|nr:helix-turn-helix transcriptional regulator [Bacteroidales bacterium]
MNERERIELLMKCYGLTPSQLADRTGIQRASVSHIISGRNKPSLEVLQKIYEAFPELDLGWLMTGKGEEPVALDFAAGDAAEAEITLFSQPLTEKEPELSVASPRRVQVERQEQPARQLQSSRSAERQRKPVVQKPRQQAVSERRIKEIRIFYTDGTYETLLPEK